MSIQTLVLTDQNNSNVTADPLEGYFLFQTGALTVTIGLGVALTAGEAPAEASIIRAGQVNGLAPDSSAIDAHNGQLWNFGWSNVPNGCGQTLQVQEHPEFGEDACSLDLEVVLDMANPDCPVQPSPSTDTSGGSIRAG